MVKDLSNNTKSTIIALETSGRAGSVAVSVGGARAVERVFSGHLKHSAELFTCLKGLLEELGSSADRITHICLDNGPGSFTGIRIAVTAAKMMAYATAAQIVSVSSMDVLAAGAMEFNSKKMVKGARIGTILDAKRGQFFTAVFKSEHGKCTKIVQDCLLTPREFIEKYAQEDIRLTGEGLVYYKDLFKSQNVRFVGEEYFSARAKHVYQLCKAKAAAGKFISAENLSANYIRHSRAKVKSK